MYHNLNINVREAEFLNAIFRSNTLENMIFHFNFSLPPSQVKFLNSYEVYKTTSQQSCRFSEQCRALDCAGSIIRHNSADTCMKEHNFFCSLFSVLLDFKMDFLWLASQALFCWSKVFWEYLIFYFSKECIIDKHPLKVIFKHRI